jgi:hypothetical protein
MSKVSSTTVRVMEIPSDVEQSEFAIVAKLLTSKSLAGGWFSSSKLGDDKPVISFATQYDGHAGTITLPSEEHKKLALVSHGTQWTLDDEFHGITVLCSPVDFDLEYDYFHLPCVWKPII